MTTLEEVVGHALEDVSATARMARVWLAATTGDVVRWAHDDPNARETPPAVVVRWAHDDALPQISSAWKTARTRDVLVAATAGYFGAAVLAPLLGRVLLRIIGFGPRGPVAGSSAARYHSLIGPEVDSGSPFSGAQSVGMGGPIPFLFKAVVGVSCGLTSLVWVVSSHS